MSEDSRIIEALTQGPLPRDIDAERASDELWSAFVRLLTHGDDDSDDSLEPLDAAYVVRTWLEQVPLTEPWGANFVTNQISKIGEKYLGCSRATKDFIETALVEHLLEKESFVPLFVSWRSNLELDAALERCLLWAREHRRD